MHRKLEWLFLPRDTLACELADPEINNYFSAKMALVEIISV